MNTKTVLTAIIVLVVAGGGQWLLMRDTDPPLQELPTAGTSPINATATLNPEQPQAGEPTTIAFAFTKADGSAVSDLMVHHARRVHALLISEDLSSIGHIHPADFGDVSDEVVRSGRYAVRYTFPRAGMYIVGVDVMTANERFSKQFLIEVKGAPTMGDLAEDLRREKCFRGYPQDGNDRYVKPVFTADAEVSCPQGYKVTMTPSDETIIAAEEVRFRYRIEKDGEGVTNLEPYLGAAMHLAMVPSSFDALLHHHGNPAGTGHHSAAMHADPHAEHQHEAAHMARMRHGGVPASFGPELVSEPFSFPQAGLYQVFAQVKHEEKIIFANFMVEVQEAS